MDNSLTFEGTFIRQKNTAKAKKGLHQKWEVKTPADMLKDSETLRLLGIELGTFNGRLQQLNIAPLYTVGFKMQSEAMAVLTKLRAELSKKRSV